jgi:hypothetical protein
MRPAELYHAIIYGALEKGLLFGGPLKTEGLLPMPRCSVVSPLFLRFDSLCDIRPSMG